MTQLTLIFGGGGFSSLSESEELDGDDLQQQQYII